MAGGELDAVVTAIGALPADATQVPDAVLAERMEQMLQARAMLDAALVEQLAAFDARGGARYDGQSSTRAWLRSRLRLDGGRAGDLVRVARQLADLPEVAKAFAAGEVSLEHVGVIARLANAVGAEALAGYEPILVELARQAPPGQLRVACEHVRQLLDPDGDADQAARGRRSRYLAAGRTVDGMVHLQGLFDAAAGDVVLAALQAAMPVPAAYEERTGEQRRADALVDVCATWLAAGDAPTSGGIRPQVQVTVSLRTLQNLTGPLGDTDQEQVDRVEVARRAAGEALRPLFGIPDAFDAEELIVGDVPVLADGQPIPAAEARRIACDAGVIPVVMGGDGEVLDIGRTSRVVPVGMRRALNLRDGGCRFAGCDRPAAWCDAHHIGHWADGGPTTLSNLVLLCAFHHTLIHEGWRLVGDPGGTVWFHRPDGTQLDLASAPRSRPPTRGP
jgi:hypothetical protein